MHIKNKLGAISLTKMSEVLKYTCHHNIDILVLVTWRRVSAPFTDMVTPVSLSVLRLVYVLGGKMFCNFPWPVM